MVAVKQMNTTKIDLYREVLLEFHNVSAVVVLGRQFFLTLIFLFLKAQDTIGNHSKLMFSLKSYLLTINGELLIV